MLKHHSFRRIPRSRGLKRSDSSRKPHRAVRLEMLEPRCLLSASPTLSLVNVPDTIVVEAGAPLHLAIDGYDADGDALTYTFDITKTGGGGTSELTGSLLDGNQSLRIGVKNYGDMIFELFEQRAPLTTAQIIELAESGFYDDVIFHRIIETFMIQGGDPTGTGTGGSDGGDFDDEFHRELMHTSSGILSMANSGPDSNDSQFFITAGPTRWLDFHHTVFGILTEGDDVREVISQVPVSSADGHPVTDVVIESMEIFTDNQNAVLELTAPTGTWESAILTVTVSDGDGNTASKTVEVLIQPDTTNNSPPMLEPMDPLYTSVNTPVEFDIEAWDREGDAIHYTVWNLEEWPTVETGWQDYQNDNLDISYNPTTGKVTVTPKNNLVGVYGILVGAGADATTSDTYPGDAKGKTDYQVIPLYIMPPAPSSLELRSVSDTGVNDTDGITNVSSELQVRVNGVQDGATIKLYVDGNEVGEATAVNGWAIITTDASATLADGTHQFTAKQVLSNQSVIVGNLDETIDLTSDASVSLAITINTTVPTITSTPIAQAEFGQSYAYHVRANDAGDGTVLFSLGDHPDGMSIDMTTGQITWTPQAGQASSQPVVVHTRSVSGLAAEQSFTVQIGSFPVIEPISAMTVAENETLTFTVTATDANTPLTYSIAGTAPIGATIDPTSGLFTWTPSESQGPATHTITIRVTDADGWASTEDVTIMVTETNTPPTLTPIGNKTVAEGQSLDFLVAVTDPDLPANRLTFSLDNGAPAGVAINPTTGRLTWEPTEAQGPGTYTIGIHVTDSVNAQSFDEATFEVTVVEIDRVPVFMPLTQQLLSPGETMRLVVEAIDPDLPAHQMALSIEGDLPNGMVFDSDNGLLTWTVPEDYIGPTVHVTVRATEILTDGTPGLSSTATIDIVVSNVWMSVVEAALRDRAILTGPSSPTSALHEAMFADIVLPNERATGPAIAFFQAPEHVDGVFHYSIYGIQFGASSGLGSGSDNPENESEPTPEEPAPSDDNPGQDDQNQPNALHRFEESLQRLADNQGQRDAAGNAAHATDAAMEHLADEIQKLAARRAPTAM